MKAEPTILEGKQVSIGYAKRKSTNVLAESLSFQLKKGKLTCLLGPNGVGKSTLIKTIMGQIPCLSGQILFLNKDIHEHPAKSLAQNISVVLTDRIMGGNLTVQQLVSLGRTPFTNWLGKLTPEDNRIILEALQATKTYYLKDQFISEISDGQLQKVMIARALAQDGNLIILDEPTAHLDLVNRYEIMHLLRDITQQQKKSILIVTHDLDIAIETADELWIMQCGSPLLCGSPEDLIISGDINQLLTNGQLLFDLELGKIRPKHASDYPQIKGAKHIRQWLKLALQKNNIKLPDDLEVQINENPLTITVSKGQSKQTSTDIHTTLEMIRALIF
ncbi:ABC transporter ATP-binding protein [Echinicola shivajiensis]|uniref:ABC transporter ATP-binding protein n=1 Tax=Echinicola shivajiensis TaxID=1035916 RepID=UPI001BFC7383|nr:ABC transporter ATP-binding protein [Echinicola shivajiensis]